MGDMRLEQKVENSVRIVDRYKQGAELTDLSFWLEMDASLTMDDIVALVESMMEDIIKEKDQFRRDDLFNVIDDAVFLRQAGEKVNWQILVDDINNLSPYDLVWLLPFLGASRKVAYLPVLMKYIRHENALIREDAIDAITEIKRKVSSSDPAFKQQREEVRAEIL
jgi:hypothetical protein